MKRRFMIVSMGSFTIVMLILFLVLNGFNYAQVINRQEQQTLDFVEMQLGINQREITLNNGATVLIEPTPKIRNNTFNFENFFGLIKEERETRDMIDFFYVVFDSEGKIKQTTIGIGENITEAAAQEAAIEIYGQELTHGWSGYYRFMKKVLLDGRTLVMYVDSFAEIEMIVRFLSLSAGIFAILLIVVYLLLAYFSKKAIMPLVKNIERQKKFISNASHEIKTPLAVLSTNNDVMEMIGYKNEWTESNRNQIKRLNMLIEQMLLLARFDEGKNTIELTKVNLTDLIKNEINELSTLIKENNKTILLELPDNLVETTDEASMRQLTTILLENAVKYHVGSEPIIIKWQPAKRELWFENECDPMTEEERKQLFERFYRRDTARNREQGGSGMGLSIAAAVAKAAGLKLTTELINPSRIAFKIGFNGYNKDSWQIKERLFKK